MKCVILLWRSLDHTGEGVGVAQGVAFGYRPGCGVVVSSHCGAHFYRTIVRRPVRAAMGQRWRAVSVAVALIATTTGTAAKLLLLSSPSSAQSGGRRSGRRWGDKQAQNIVGMGTCCVQVRRRARSVSRGMECTGEERKQ